MAWRLGENLINGELDNTNPGKITGWMRFKGLRGKVQFNLKGDFHRDIRGTKIRFSGEGENRDIRNGQNYMRGFSRTQNGNAGDITAGIPTGQDTNGEFTYDYVNYPYIEWYADNGRCVIEIDHSQMEVIGKPIPAIESDPIDRTKQHKLMMNFLSEISKGINQ